MKRNLLFVIPLLMLTACGREKTYVVGETAFCTGLEDSNPESVYCVDDKDAPINGIVIEHFENGNIHREMTIKNGRENGLEKEYYEDGTLRVETNAVDGRAVGGSKLYNPDGKLYMEMNWVDGTATDIKVYDDAGNIVATMPESK